MESLSAMGRMLPLATHATRGGLPTHSSRSRPGLGETGVGQKETSAARLRLPLCCGNYTASEASV